MTVKSHFSFQEDYVISFDKIITYMLRKESSGYKLCIKQEGATSHSEIVVTQENYLQFKQSYSDYLDYKLKHSIKDNELISYFLKEKESLFNEIRENFKSLGEELKEDYRKKVAIINQENKESFEEIKENFDNTIEKIERTHSNLDREYDKLRKVNEIFDNFDVESLLDTEVKEGEIVN